MARDRRSDQIPVSMAGETDAVMAAFRGLDRRDLHSLLQRLRAAGAAAEGRLEEARSPSRRRPRRTDIVTYRVRIDLKGARPPAWRRLELASDLNLAEVHDIIQAAFGWTNSHLHGFGSGPGYYGPYTEHYLCPFEEKEGKEGIPEAQVRLDEVLAEVGDKLHYVYDFGDDWQHTIKLEAVLPRDEAAPRAVCTRGRRPGPAEDCGGVHAYDLIAAATDLDNPDHAEAVAAFDRFYGNNVDPEVLRTTPFDVDEINSALARLAFARPRPTPG